MHRSRNHRRERAKGDERRCERTTNRCRGHLALHGAERVAQWRTLIEQDHWDTLVERLLLEHYDPSYDRSMRRNFTRLEQAATVRLSDADTQGIGEAVQALRSLAGAHA